MIILGVVTRLSAESRGVDPVAGVDPVSGVDPSIGVRPAILETSSGSGSGGNGETSGNGETPGNGASCPTYPGSSVMSGMITFSAVAALIFVFFDDLLVKNLNGAKSNLPAAAVKDGTGMDWRSTLTAAGSVGLFGDVARRTGRSGEIGRSGERSGEATRSAGRSGEIARCPGAFAPRPPPGSLPPGFACMVPSRSPS